MAITNDADKERALRILQGSMEITEEQRSTLIGDLRSYDTQQTQVAAQDERLAAADPSFGNQLARKSAIVGEGLATGVADTADFLLSPLTGAAYGLGRLFGDVEEGTYGSFADLSNLVEDLELAPDPITKTEKILAGLSRAAGGAIGGVGIGRGVAAAGAKTVGGWLSAQPVIQTGAAMTGESLRMVAESQGAGAGWQTAYALGGALGYGMMAPRAMAGILRTASGVKNNPASAQSLDALDNLNGELKSINKMNDEFNAMAGEAGLPPSGRTAEAMLSRIPDDTVGAKLLRNVPGARGHVDETINAVEEGIGTLLRHQRRLEANPKIARDAAGDAYAVAGEFVDDALAGKAIRTGLDQAIDTFKATAKANYDELDTLIPSDANMVTSNLSKYLRGHTKDEWSDLFGSDFIAELDDTLATSGTSFSKWVNDLGALMDDSIPDDLRVLSYASLKSLRKQIGAKLANPSLMDDTPRGELKQIYKAITDDIGLGLDVFDMTAAKLKIGPHRSMAALAREADEAYGAGRTLFDETLATFTRKIVGEAVPPEQLFEALMRNTRAAPSVVKRLKAEMLKAGGRKTWDTVAQGVVERMGRANPGQQNAAGTRFSLETFLTRWNQMDDGAKRAVFQGQKSVGGGKDMYDLFNDIALVAEKGRKARQTAGGRDISQALLTGGPISAGIGVVMSGSPLWLAGAVMAGISAKGAAVLMTNAKWGRFLREIAARPTMAPAALAAAMSKATEDHPEEGIEALSALQMLLESSQTSTDRILQQGRE